MTAASLVARTDSDGGPGIHARVMIVDDDESIRTMLETILRHDGHEAVSAASGAEALRQLRAGPLPDLVLLDLMMPGICGWDVIESMSESPRLAEVPVVVLTAFGDGAELPACRPVLHKPVDDEVLRALIDELLAQRQRLLFALEEPPSDLLPQRRPGTRWSPPPAR
jgi:two-component system, chemotaxis family, chemotaxis protein CheY